MLKIVSTTEGSVRGLPAADPRIISYKGIPFARPPVGELRWRAPQPCEKYEGVRDCFQFAPISMQSIPGLDADNIYTNEWNVDPAIPMSEDCLYLNVWTPAKSPDERLPVFVWFFGGALQWGNCAEMEFDGERIARRGIVVVTVNYRLNVFGFLTHPQMRREDPHTPYNLGNLDQQAGLRWVKENIAAFGGNPDRITIGGQSAGGGSVMTQLNCRENRGLIHGAIVESGVFLNPFEKMFEITLEESVRQSLDFFAFLGVDSLEEARRLPAEYIRDRNDAFGRFWGTVIDGVFQTDTYWNNIRNRQFPDVPILAGYTDNEFIFQGINVIELGTNRLYLERERNGYQAPQFLYEFGVDIPGADQPGAFHSSDLWFFFETLAKCTRPFAGRHYDLSRQMCNYWCHFMKTGNPGGCDLDGKRMEEWKAFGQQDRKIMFFHDVPRLQNKKLPEKLACYMERDIHMFGRTDVF